jgi:ribosomal protein S18 acetylase RimI-like enzyme
MNLPHSSDGAVRCAMQPLPIEPVSPPAFDAFIAYLNAHLAENGTDEVGYFQPLSRATSSFPADREAAFRAGLVVPVGEAGWRRLWVARDADGGIAGHVDLRGLGERHTAHRCLLGMGVHRAHRRRGLGKALVAHARAWAAETPPLEWIDLHVLNTNRAASALYRQAGFAQVGEVAEMFRIDGQDLSSTTMTLRVRARRGA